MLQLTKLLTKNAWKCQKGFSKLKSCLLGNGWSLRVEQVKTFLQIALHGDVNSMF